MDEIENVVETFLCTLGVLRHFDISITTTTGRLQRSLYWLYNINNYFKTITEY